MRTSLPSVCPSQNSNDDALSATPDASSLRIDYVSDLGLVAESRSNGEWRREDGWKVRGLELSAVHAYRLIAACSTPPRLGLHLQHSITIPSTSLFHSSSSSLPIPLPPLPLIHLHPTVETPLLTVVTSLHVVSLQYNRGT